MAITKSGSRGLLLTGLLILAFTPSVLARVPGADLQITKDTVPSGLVSVVAGGTITYRTIATNYGDDAAVDLLIYDETPSGTWYAGYSASTGASCTVSPAGIGGAEVSCTWVGSTAMGGSRWLDLTVTVCSGNTCSYDIVSDMAYASSATFDPLPGDEMQTGYYGLGMVAAVTTGVTTQSAFATAAYGIPGAISSGGQVTYTIDIDNLGPSSALTTVTTVLPTGWTVSSVASASFGTCSGLGGSFATCDTFLGGSAVCVASFFTDTITVVADVGYTAQVEPKIITTSVTTTNCEPDSGDLVVHVTTWVGAIFADGFESANTMAWSTTVY